MLPLHDLNMHYTERCHTEEVKWMRSYAAVHKRSNKTQRINTEEKKVMMKSKRKEKGKTLLQRIVEVRLRMVGKWPRQGNCIGHTVVRRWRGLANTHNVKVEKEHNCMQTLTHKYGYFRDNTVGNTDGELRDWQQIKPIDIYLKYFRNWTCCS